jgi:hypothetical protein
MTERKDEPSAMPEDADEQRLRLVALYHLLPLLAGGREAELARHRVLGNLLPRHPGEALN